jgi:hypothetical protein
MSLVDFHEDEDVGLGLSSSVLAEPSQPAASRVTSLGLDINPAPFSMDAPACAITGGYLCLALAMINTYFA